jgi:hypothetical protein
MNIEDTIVPKSDQLDAIELVNGPRIFTVERVTRGSDEQPVNIHFVDFPRPWRPSKSMRRVIVACWGADASQYAGRRVELFCDLDVVFGGKAVGGTRISRISHIDKPKSLPLLVARGKSAVFTVNPLPDAPPPDPTAARIAALRSEWHGADPDRRKEIEAQVAELSAGQVES